MGYARHGCRISAGRVRIGDIDVLALDAAQQRALRGRTVAYIAQSAAASFNPSRTIMDQVVEPTVIHGLCKRAEAEAKAVQLFRELALPDPETIGAALSAPGLRRPAAAADGGDGADRRPRARDPRRADHRARRDDADRGAARLPPRGARAPCHRGVREPRPGRGRADGRPHPRAARRQDARAERDRADPLGAGGRLHQEPAGRCAAGAARIGQGGQRRPRAAARDRSSSRPATGPWTRKGARPSRSCRTSTSSSTAARRSA